MAIDNRRLRQFGWMFLGADCFVALRLRLTPTLATVIGVFILLTTVTIVVIEFRSSQNIIRSLGSDFIWTSMQGLSLEFDGRGMDVEDQALFIASSIEAGTVLLEDKQNIALFIYGALAGTVQTSSIWVIDQNGRTVGVEQGDGDGVMTPNFGRVEDTAFLLETFKFAQSTKDPFWTEPVFFASKGQSYFVHAVPILEGDKTIGLVLSTVSLRRVSEIADEMSDEYLTVFMIDDEALLAHPNMKDALPNLSSKRLFPSINDVSDPFLANYKSLEKLPAEELGLEENFELYFGTDASGQERFLVIRHPLEGEFSTIPIGAHFDAAVLVQPYEQMLRSSYLAVAILLVALVCAILLARWIARPVRRAASGARHVAAFELEAVQTLPASNIRELNDLASGFNSMVGVLNAFVRYVPRSLVRRILSEGSDVSAPAERQLAVLFTDIAGFTSISEKMSAVETAEFINQHLTIVGGAIERHGGTIDKYIGDSVMAFWGAPEQSEHPEKHALAAANAITLAIRADNKAREDKGLPPVRIRIGLHVGPLVVGDIGAPGRVNYTVIGDTVNIASRLESMGRDVDPSADVVILASREVIGKLDMPDISVESIGNRTVKGKLEPVEVVRVSV